MKTVNYFDYQDSLDAVNAGLADGIQIQNLSFDDTIQMGVNFSALGTVKPEDAAAYANEIQRATKLAADFPLNGYQIVY